MNEYVMYKNGGASLEKKTLKTWRPEHYSAKREIEWNLRLLRARAADLYKNSALGAAAINTLVSGVISSGLKVYPRVRADLLGISSQAAREWSRQVKREFELWSQGADYLRRNNFYELQRIAFASSLVDGDSFCLMKRRVPDKNNPYSLRIQLVEAGRVSNPGGDNVETVYSGRRIINGVEIDDEGALEAIWISNRQYNEPDFLGSGLEWRRVEVYGRGTGCRNVLQICADTRPEQYRGVPLLAPVIESLKQVSRYTDAELTSSIIKSFFSVFFTQAERNLSLSEISGQDELDVTEYKLGSGTVSALPPGVDVKAITASNAQNVFNSFVTHYIKQIGAAINIPYEVLMKNFQSSYSASRAALIQANNEYRSRKAFFVNDFCRPIYENFLLEAVGSGRIEAAGFDDPLRRACWLNAEWYKEENQILDPVRESNAMVTRLQNGLSTYEKEIAESTGADFEEIAERLKEERKIMREIGGLE